MTTNAKPETNQPNVMETQTWLNAHHGSGHGMFSISNIPHPDGNWRLLACPCGSRHTTIVDNDELIADPPLPRVEGTPNECVVGDRGGATCLTHDNPVDWVECSGYRCDVSGRIVTKSETLEQELSREARERVEGTQGREAMQSDIHTPALSVEDGIHTGDDPRTDAVADISGALDEIEAADSQDEILEYVEAAREALNVVDKAIASLVLSERRAPLPEGEKPVPEGWQPIETAPKDGTRILVARYMEPYGWIVGDAVWVDVLGVAGWLPHGLGFFGELGLAHPTHWMPVPSPSERYRKDGDQ